MKGIPMLKIVLDFVIIMALEQAKTYRNPLNIGKNQAIKITEELFIIYQEQMIMNPVSMDFKYGITPTIHCIMMFKVHQHQH